MCSCKDGCLGKFCKHVAAVYRFFDLKINNIPSVTIEGQITLGEENVSLRIFPSSSCDTMIESERKAFRNRSNELRILAAATLCVLQIYKMTIQLPISVIITAIVN